MPVIRCYVDDEIMKRLKVYAHEMGQDAEVMAECAIAEAAIKAVPCVNGRPVSKRFNVLWDTV